jgi:multidrug efflux pump subunit AcrB
VPLILSSVTIVVAFLPLAFITGMMGPYMAPMAFNVPVSVISSTVVAFLVTPWMASRLLREPVAAAQPAVAVGLYERMMAPLLDHRGRARRLLWVVGLLFLFAALLPALRWVPLKLLPFDNKNEVQVLIDMPESASLEQTAAATRAIASEVLRLRDLLAPFSSEGRVIRVVEVPPGPPVLSTVVAEVYGESLTPYARQQAAAVQVMDRLRREPHVVEVDASIEAPQQRLRFVTDRQKAALSGVSTDDIASSLAMANAGYVAGYLQAPRELKPLPVELRLAPAQRAQQADLERLQVRGRAGVVKLSSPQGLDVAPQPLVPLGELGEFRRDQADTPIFRKDLRPVVYVTAELNGRVPGAVIADVVADLDLAPGTTPDTDWERRTYFSNGGGDGWSLPPGIELRWAGEGELKITLDVFRDMGLGYLFALLAIFVVLRIQTGSVALSLIIMLAIPLTIIGIMPGFWAMNHVGERVIAGAPEPVLFTATAMIGMIALAGIVVRNSLILVEFITQARAEGMPIREALISAGAVRMRPVLLTAGTTLLGNLVITLDPVFNGLALAIIFGIIASTLFTLLVVPVVYWLVFERESSTPSTPSTPSTAATAVPAPAREEGDTP